jgi:RND family efflux transporter MFP subunit
MGVRMKTVLIVMLLTLPGAAWWYSGSSAGLALQADVAVQFAMRSRIAEVVDATGVIKPQNGAEVRVGSRISGVLRTLHADIGDSVHAGQLLAELADEELRASLALMRARVSELEAQLDYSRLLLQRNERAGVLSELDLANLRKAVAIDEARLAQMQASLDSEQIRLSWTRVTAPIAGTVASVSTQQGETIAASFAAPTFLTIIDLNRLEIQAYVDEADIGGITLGQSVHFSVDTFPDARFDGVVSTIYPKAEIVNNVVNYIVIIGIATPFGAQLRPEMTARVQFVVREAAGALLVPRSALFVEESGKQGQYYLMVTAAEGWQKQPVQVGIVNAGVVEITQGLSDDQRFASDREQWLAHNATHEE